MERDDVTLSFIDQRMNLARPSFQRHAFLVTILIAVINRGDALRRTRRVVQYAGKDMERRTELGPASCGGTAEIVNPPVLFDGFAFFSGRHFGDVCFSIGFRFPKSGNRSSPCGREYVLTGWFVIGVAGAEYLYDLGYKGRGLTESPLCPRKQTLVAQGPFGIKKRASNVRLTPKSGHKWLCRGMSAYDPKRTFGLIR